MNQRGKQVMARTSIQDILLKEIQQLREDSRTQNTLLTEVATTLRDVKEQTTKTNGRVTRAEDRLNFQRGGIYVAYVAIGIVIAILTLIK